MKRGASGYSLIIGVDKERGMSSHDVVNRVRSIFTEKRVGHLGTLDPLAEGVLPVCIGPATRITPYFHEHSKTYRFGIAFGTSTSTDDEEGEVLLSAACPQILLDGAYARGVVQSFLGTRMQMPPVYSAKKVNGKKSCDAARKGESVALEPVAVRVDSIDVTSIESCGNTVLWNCEATVSTGTYVRSLVRDIGEAVDCPAHAAYIRRMNAGAVSLSLCKTLEEIERDPKCAIIDPVTLLGYPCVHADMLASALGNGTPIPPERFGLMEGATGIDRLTEGSLVSLCVGDALKALYSMDGEGRLVPSCVFALPIARG